MKSHFLFGSLDITSGFLPEARTPRSSRHESSTRCDTIYIPSDDSITPTVFKGFYSLSKRETKDTVPHISEDAGINGLKSQHARRQPQTSLARSTWRAPLQQSVKVLQAGATTVDVPGTGGGKENIPPGFSVIANKKSKSKIHSPVSKMARPAMQNATPRTRVSTKPKKARKEPLKRAALGETRGNVVRVRVPKKIEHSPPAETVWVSPLERTYSAIVIQRTWRSFTERRNKHACTIATVRTKLAYEVIARWWRGVKARKLREQTNQVKLMERTEQMPRRKSAGQRSSVRQNQPNSGRRGIRRL
ncbi:hypothetical protein N7537_003109 [Penicillium hordei]|uniref:Uncharacterized protein n=1 Tax=Penicillium hordei TaxID=40994 RepID=A0AAD6MP89_9EURO|nr:uncharacterized protein N7537_003109 [Penicillium hordei]KAJ5617995.1 hypothetical protein N7537_003109 [Penicillium hordei]